MDQPFPFGFPGPTAFYLVLFVLTLVLHVVFMNYVLAGAGVLVWAGLRKGGDLSGPVESKLIDWLPFALSGAITAAVAPLLFLQILYRQPFYTANLLLFHRWMAMLPVLIVGFYLLYVVKAPRLEGSRLRIAAAGGAVLCFLFAAWSWTENSLLTLAGAEWATFYKEARVVHWDPVLLPRLGMWVFGALPTMALVCLWQIGARGSDEEVPGGSYSVRGLARLALVGLLLAMLCGGIYAAIGGPSVRAALFGPLGRWYLSGALLAAFGQLLLWWPIARTGIPQRFSGLVLATLVTIVCMTVVREAIRLVTLDAQASLEPLFPQHAQAASKSGFWLFLAFAAVNAGIAAYCIRLARNKSNASEQASE